MSASRCWSRAFAGPRTGGACRSRRSSRRTCPTTPPPPLPGARSAAPIVKADAATVAGFPINRFRDDPSLFDHGDRLIEAQTGWRGFGVCPRVADAWKLPAEDAMDLSSPRRDGGLHIVSLAFGRIADFDDPDPLAQEPGVRLIMPGPDRAIPGDAGLVILHGTKSTRGGSGLFARAVLTYRPCRASAARRSCAGHLRRLPDARTRGGGPRGT